MNKKVNFDEQIKQKLEGLHTPPSYGSWDSFQSKMDGLSDPTSPMTNSFDQKVKDKLDKIQPGFKSAHWEKLKYKLETIELFRRKIILHKAKELLAVLLFLFTFYNVTLYKATWFSNEKNMYASIPDVNTIEETSRDENNNAFTSKEDVAVKVLKNSQLPKTRKRKTISTVSKLAPAGHSFESKFDSPRNIVSSVEKEFELDVLDVVSINNAQINLSLEPLASLEPSNNETYSLYATIIPMGFASRTPHQKWSRLGVYFAHIDNFILSPFDKVYSIPKFANSTRNQGYGVVYGKKHNRWEIEAGLAYSRLEYKPAEVREVFGNTGEISFETSLQKIHFDLWKVPVSMKYFAVDKNSWKYYTVLGTSLNVISDATYSIEENIVLGRPFAPIQYTQDGPRLEEKAFNNGVVNDGKIKGNYYIDAFFGMGIEKKITPFASVYLQPAYHTFLFSDGIGVGPNNDKLNAFHLQTGVKFQFAD